VKTSCGKSTPQGARFNVILFQRHHTSHTPFLDIPAPIYIINLSFVNTEKCYNHSVVTSIRFARSLPAFFNPGRMLSQISVAPPTLTSHTGEHSVRPRD
jgi:hypothetical protein